MLKVLSSEELLLAITKDNLCNLLWICKLQENSAKMFLFSPVFQTIIVDSSGWLHPNFAEFDKIYLPTQYKDKSILKAGHLDLQDDQTYLERYQRRSMGIGFQTNFWERQQNFFWIFRQWSCQKWISQNPFSRCEGNQRSISFKWKKRWNFITILSGSEQVFIDGILMKRGENQDYHH